MIDHALNSLASNPAFMDRFFHVALFCAEFAGFLLALAAAAIATTALFSFSPKRISSSTSEQKTSCPDFLTDLPLELGLCAGSTRITVHGEPLPVEVEDALEIGRR